MKNADFFKKMISIGILFGSVSGYAGPNFTSPGTAEYKDEFSRYDGVAVDRVHVVIKDIARLGLCGSFDECYRAYVYVNGNEQDGDHIGTFMTSPGREGDHQDFNPAIEEYVTTKGIYTEEGDYSLEYKGQTPLSGAAEADRKGLRFDNFNMFKLYKSGASFGAKMPFAMFFNKGQALHCSYGAVDGNRHSHGCVRLRCGEAEKLYNLVSKASGNLTVSIRDTIGVSVLSEEEKFKAYTRELLGITKEEQEQISFGSGGLY
ncbi:MAG: L,D-transpeptidase [Bdellovibrionales bacterium]